MADPAASALLDPLLSMGLPGVVIAGLSFWIVRLQRKLEESQEARVQMALRLAEANNELAAAVERNTEVLRMQELDRTPVVRRERR